MLRLRCTQSLHLHIRIQRPVENNRNDKNNNTCQQQNLPLNPFSASSTLLSCIEVCGRESSFSIGFSISFKSVTKLIILTFKTQINNIQTFKTRQTSINNNTEKKSNSDRYCKDKRGNNLVTGSFNEWYNF